MQTSWHWRTAGKTKIFPRLHRKRCANASLTRAFHEATALWLWRRSSELNKSSVVTYTAPSTQWFLKALANRRSAVKQLLGLPGPKNSRNAALKDNIKASWKWHGTCAHKCRFIVPNGTQGERRPPKSPCRQPWHFRPGNFGKAVTNPKRPREAFGKASKKHSFDLGESLVNLSCAGEIKPSMRNRTLQSEPTFFERTLCHVFMNQQELPHILLGRYIPHVFHPEIGLRSYPLRDFSRAKAAEVLQTVRLQSTQISGLKKCKQLCVASCTTLSQCARPWVHDHPIWQLVASFLHLLSKRLWPESETCHNSAYESAQPMAFSEQTLSEESCKIF